MFKLIKFSEDFAGIEKFSTKEERNAYNTGWSDAGEEYGAGSCYCINEEDLEKNNSLLNSEKESIKRALNKK